MFYCVKYFSISIMRFKITSALVLHRFMKISLRRMFSRSVSGRPLRKPNNFCISPLASERLFKASISLSVKRCLGYLPSNRLRAYALVVSPQRAAYSAISLWSCGVSLTIKTKEEEKPSAWPILKKREDSNNSASQKHPQIQSKT